MARHSYELQNVLEAYVYTKMYLNNKPVWINVKKKSKPKYVSATD